MSLSNILLVARKCHYLSSGIQINTIENYHRLARNKLPLQLNVLFQSVVEHDAFTSMYDSITISNPKPANE